MEPDKGVKMTLTDDDIETITCALKHYLQTNFQLITDFTKVIQNRTELEVEIDNTTMTLYKYECPGQTIYLDNTHYPWTYDNQLVVNDEYLYDFNEDNLEDTPGTYTYINTSEWQRTSETEDWMYVNQEEE